MTAPLQPRLYACAGCNTDAWSVPDAPDGDPLCARCGQTMKAMYGTPAVLPPNAEPMDETLTSFLAGPLPEEALKNSENPANLFGKYVFLREIGRGATGRVVKAWDTYLSRYVALKFLHSSAPQNVELDASERVQDFLREARIAARLQHPNIVRIHEVDCRENRYFISMDFVGGGTLADLIHGTQEPKKQSTRFYTDTDRLLKLLRQIAIAVHHAHTQIPPVVHRDLKPQNVLIDAQGQPHVADFGLANEVQLERGDGRRGDVRGTPAYMAPEQALGEIHDIDPRTDVYSLGTILYEMLTGDAPFRGSNIPSVLRKIVTELPEPPSLLLGKLVKKPPGLDASPSEMRAALELLCLQSLSKKREDRPQSALDFAEALEPWIQKRDPSARTTEIRGYFKRRRLRLVVMASVPLLAVVLLLSWKFRAPSPAAAQPTAIGDEIAGVASGFLSSGRWTSFGEAVIELRRRAPGHPRLPEFEAALRNRGEDVQKHRNEWASLLSTLGTGALPSSSEDFRIRLQEIPEIEEELRAGLDLAVTRLASSLLEHAREIVGEPRDSWESKETKVRAAAVKDRTLEIDRFARDLELAADLHPLAEARTLLEPVLGWRGTWNLRINVRPFAEFRILQDGKERARDFTPSAFGRMEIGQAPAEIELFWPSEKNPQRRWKTTLGDLKSGQTIVVSGSMDSSDLEVERK
jgi:serine/threonine protein kinase